MQESAKKNNKIGTRRQDVDKKDTRTGIRIRPGHGKEVEQDRDKN
jgi:hypothetical protein